MYEFPVTVEFEDVDSYSIAHHTKIIAYLERARVHFFVENGLDLHKFGYGLVLRNINISFKIPLLMMDNITVQISTKNITKFRFSWEYKIIKDGKPAATADVEQAFIDLSTKRLTPIPEQALAILKKIEKNSDKA